MTRQASVTHPCLSHLTCFDIISRAGIRLEVITVTLFDQPAGGLLLVTKAQSQNVLMTKHRERLYMYIYVIIL